MSETPTAIQSVYDTVFIQMEPFTYSLKLEKHEDLCRYKLSEIEIHNLIKFHLENTDFKEMDYDMYCKMKKFIYESLSHLVKYEVGYTSWRDDRALTTLFHQAYDRVENYMNVLGVYNVNPFLTKSQLKNVVVQMPQIPVDTTVNTSIPMSVDKEVVDVIPAASDVIAMEEGDAVFNQLMNQLCKKFTGMRV